ncbi:unnamed protein product [Euphydryas editha]|uniref:Uncharacterized protein n=1 Tax=Euphydryas editha TaxID=104508 RepID=A0AAU9TNX7_EUPED|nr:unnamed protein product [Euphydryas editha]
MRPLWCHIDGRPTVGSKEVVLVGDINELPYIDMENRIRMMFFLDCACRASPCTLPFTPFNVPGLPGLWLWVDLDNTTV